MYYKIKHLSKINNKKNSLNLTLNYFRINKKQEGFIKSLWTMQKSLAKAGERWQNKKKKYEDCIYYL